MKSLSILIVININVINNIPILTLNQHGADVDADADDGVRNIKKW